jgi:mRNA interferase MazF
MKPLPKTKVGWMPIWGGFRLMNGGRKDHQRESQWATKNPNLYRHLPAGSGGIPQASIALLDQIRALDVRRVTAYLGRLEPEIFTSIRNNLLQLFDQKNE